VVTVRVVARTAPYSAGTAEWDGVTQSVEGFSRVASVLDPQGNAGGRLAANSLEVRILDPAGVALFEGIGGIELTEQVASGRRTGLPESQLFANAAADLRAIDVALAPLAPVRR